MRFTMSTTEEKKSSDVPSFVIAQSEISPTAEKKSKKNVVIAVTSVVVVAVVLIAILVGVYMFTQAEKDLLEVTMQLKHNMTQVMSSNPNTNVVQFHVKGSDQEAWTVNDYNSDLKVMKIQTATETNCFVTALNESAPSDLPKMKSNDAQDKVGSVSVSYTTSGSPIKDNSFLSKTARDMCSGVSTYWLYPTCNGPVDGNAPNTTIAANGRQKRATVYYSTCNIYYYVSYCSFSKSCTYYPPCSSFCLSRIGTCSCYNFQWIWTYPKYYCSSCMYQCTGFNGSSFTGCQIIPNSC